ncbi:hypothetical protein DL93DRAFT_739958 [Clavulina sp. PMI_390]|nr:hypothetical protein DL93DRAFT_739958 [Clavulina sp. PMI_390]
MPFPYSLKVETFPEVTRLVISESVRHDHPALGGIQSFTSLKRLFHKVRFSALSEIHVIAEFGPGALVGLVSTIVESSPKSVNNEDQQIKRLSLSPLSQDSVSWFQEQIDKIRSMLQVLEKWCEQEGRDPYSPDSIVDWMEHALGRHQRDEYRHFLTFQHFEAGGYLRSLESWLSLSRSIEEFQVVEPDLDPNIFRAANFRQSNEFTRSANVATAQQFIRETRNSLQQEVFDSGLWSQVMEIRELHRDANGIGSDFELDDDSSGGDDVDG